MTKLIFLRVGAFLVLSSLSLYAAAQVTGGLASGTVRDHAGQAVTGATITVTNLGNNQSRKSVTDAEGYYRIPTLAVGQYEIIIEAEGFMKVTRQLTLRVSEEARLDFELAAPEGPGGVTVVGASVPLTEAGSSVLGTVIENRQIADFPLSGRNFLHLGTMVANVNSTPSLRSGAEGGARNGPFAVAGQRDRSLTFLVDGVDNTNSLSDSLSAKVSLEAIQEFKMMTSLASAEYGYHSGGTINIVTKSGTNDFRFGLFEFWQNDKLTSPNHFLKVSGRPAGPFDNNQFGAVVSGPVIKDRTFFVANYEGQRLRAGTAQFTNVPTEDERRGIFRSPMTGQEVRVPVDPVSAEILRRYVPLPNAEGEYGNYISTPTVRARDDFALFRVDHLLSGEALLNARYYISDRHTFYALNPEMLRFGQQATIPGFALAEPTRTQNLAVAYTQNFDAQTVNDLRLGYNRYSLDQLPETQVRPEAVGFTGVPAGAGSLAFSAVGVSRIGSSAYPIYSRLGNFHVADSLSFMRGRHALKVGGELRYLRQSLSHFGPWHASAAFNGSASRISPLADFVMGAPVAVSVYTRAQASPMRQAVGGLFVQDDYQPHDRLTLNLGVRYELATVLNSPTHRLTNFSFGRGLFTPGSDTTTGLYRGDHNNFAPRVGFAWMATRDGRTVLRGGYGVFYDTIVHTIASQLNRQNAPAPLTQTSRAPLPPGSLSRALEASRLVGTPLPSIAYDENLRTPYAQHFNLTLQRELSNTTMVSLGYVGSRGTKLVFSRDINQAIYLPGLDASGRPHSTAAPANIISRRPSQLYNLTPYPVGSVEEVSTGASSTYHSFQATFAKRAGHGLSVLGTYTWSKSIDNAADPYGFTGDVGFPQDSNNLAAERALSVFDVRHQATAGYSYQLPFRGGPWAQGWLLNGVATLRSGQPFTAILGFDPSLTGSSFVRPNYAEGAFTNSGGQVYLNRDLRRDEATGLPASIIPGTGQVGNLGRNTFTGPGYKGVDMSVIKESRLGERLKLQARLEVFNVFNLTNLAIPERRLTDPSFGRSVRTQDVAGGLPGIGGGGPRMFQLALKIIY